MPRAGAADLYYTDVFVVYCNDCKMDFSLTVQINSNTTPENNKLIAFISMHVYHTCSFVIKQHHKKSMMSIWLTLALPDCAVPSCARETGADLKQRAQMSNPEAELFVHGLRSLMNEIGEQCFGITHKMDKISRNKSLNN